MPKKTASTPKKMTKAAAVRAAGVNFLARPEEPGKRPGHGRHNIATLEKLIKVYKGNLTKTAEAAGVSRVTMAGLIDRQPLLKAALDDARARWIDEVEESVLTRAVESQDTQLQIFILRTQARNRGYDLREAETTAKDIAAAAFEYICNKSKNPAESNR